MTFFQKFSNLVYMLEFMLNGHKRSILIHAIDGPNGVVMDDPQNDGNMRAKTLGGNEIRVKLDNVLMVERRFVVSRFNGQTTRSQNLNEAQVKRVIEQSTNQETGEVQGIREIREVGNDDNRVTERQEPEGGWK